MKPFWVNIPWSNQANVGLLERHGSSYTAALNKDIIPTGVELICSITTWTASSKLMELQIEGECPTISSAQL